MRNSTFTGLLVVAGIGLGCAPQAMRTQFDPSHFQASMKQGTASVKGQAFLKTRGGEVRYGAGNKVELVPMTPYIRERLERATIQGERLEPRDPRVESFVKTTIADGNGNFEFNNVGSGEYVIYCMITWEIPNGFAPIATGGMAYATVRVDEGGSYKVIVTR